MKSLLMLLAALCACTAATARPMVIESQAALPPYSDDFAFAGNELISTNWEPVPNTNYPEEFYTIATLYRRGTDGKWTLVRELARDRGTDGYGARVAMTSSIAAISMPSGLQIWERSASGWARANVNGAPQLVGNHVDVVGNTVLIPAVDVNIPCPVRAAVVTRGTNGVWAMTAQLDAPAGTCVGDLDLDEGRAILGVQDGDPGINIDRAVIFEQSGSSWNLVATLPRNDTSVKFATSVALRGDLAVVSASNRGSHVYNRSTAGWQLVGFLPNQDAYAAEQDDYEIDITDQYVVKTGSNINRRTTVAYVYRRLTNRTFEHVANLAARYGVSKARIDGTRVIGGVTSVLYEFNLPSSFAVPAVVQDDFESGAATAWTPIPGSQFAIVSNGQTRVYRQSSVAGDAGAIHSADFTNQHVSADIRPIAFQGSGDQWVGLITRYTDPDNFYYVTLRNQSQRLALRRVLNGVITELATYSMPVTLAWHRIGLESTGTLHNVYVDGKLVAYATDASHTHGHAGIRTYRASADFDNVVVSPGPLASLAYTERVTTGGVWDGNWMRGGSTFIQTVPDSGDAQALSGLPRADAAVQATVTFGTASSSGTPWVGLIVRYVDSRNFYYVTMRANELSLRKLTNGAITVLDSEPFTRQAGVPVNMRLEAVGDRLRVYVNDELRIERAGAAIAAGKVGLMTYRASASFENYWAYEP
jgi:hypothetical protein